MITAKLLKTAHRSRRVTEPVGYEFLRLFKNLASTVPDTVASAKPTIKTMNYSLGTILAVIAIILVLATYLTGAPLVPVAVILLALAIIFGGTAARPV